MNRLFVLRNINLFSIAIFLVSFAFINFLKPNFLYNDDGSLENLVWGIEEKQLCLDGLLLLF